MFSYHLLSKMPVDLLALHQFNPQRYPFLLESVAGGHAHARFDILFAFPQQVIVLDAQYVLWVDGRKANHDDFLDQLDMSWQQTRQARQAGVDAPFRGGWFVYLGYELVQQIETTLTLPVAEDNFPTAFAVRVPAAFIQDRLLGQTYLMVEQAFSDLLPEMQSDFAQLDMHQRVDCQAPVDIDLIEEDANIYLHNIEKILKYIKNGDVFQVNLSRLWHGCLPVEHSIINLYAKLREQNPAPFSGLVHWFDSYIISSSPERLVKVTADKVQVRPIAGTAARQAQANDHVLDQQRKQALIKHPKERAEHIMLIDLERNDLGRVCVAGSVNVDELMVLESYAHVHHIVSNVVGTLDAQYSPGRLIKAVFPGGTITGCPKVRCMEIIAELEQSRRRAYTGSMGYLNHDGDLDLNILIRTIEQHKTAIFFRAGAGIVADSQASRELAETRAKAKGLIMALQQ